MCLVTTWLSVAQSACRCVVLFGLNYLPIIRFLLHFNLVILIAEMIFIFLQYRQGFSFFANICSWLVLSTQVSDGWVLNPDKRR